MGAAVEGSDWDFGPYYRGGLDPADISALGWPGRVFAHRRAIPRDTWGHFFGHAQHKIGALVHSGMFISEDIGGASWANPRLSSVPCAPSS